MTPWTAAHTGFPVLHYLLEFIQTHVHWVGAIIQPSHPLSPLSPPALNLFQHQVLFQGVFSSHQVAKVLELSFSTSTFSEFSGLISFRIDWFDLLVAQGPLKSHLQHYGSKASILWHSVFFMVQLSYLYIATGKTITFTIWTFVSKLMFLLFTVLPGLVIAFLPRSKHFLISWVHSQWFWSLRK